MRRIASRQNAVVSRYRAAARGIEPGTMLLDGAHLVAEALAAGVTFREAAVAADADAEAAALAARLERAGVDVVSVTAPVIAAISPVRSPSAIVALADRPDRDGAIGDGAVPLIVIAIDVQDPGNVGAIVRVAEAGGASGVIVAGASADPFGWKALRGSMGSALRLPVAVQSAPDLAALRRRGCRLIATSPHQGRSVFDVDLRGPTAVMIGGEGPGLTSDQLAQADDRVTIPMQTPVESLNTAVAAALIVYEARRQRSAR